jgi:hypothetical protein
MSHFPFKMLCINILAILPQCYHMAAVMSQLSTALPKYYEETYAYNIEK